LQAAQTGAQTQPRGQFVSPTAIEHGANRGVKKIIKKRRDEQKTFQLRALPDPPLPPSPVAGTFSTSTTAVNNSNYMHRPVSCILITRGHRRSVVLQFMSCVLFVEILHLVGTLEISIAGNFTIPRTSPEL